MGSQTETQMHLALVLARPYLPASCAKSMAQKQREIKLLGEQTALTDDLFHLILHAVLAVSDEKILERDAAYPADNDEALTPDRVAAARESFFKRYVGEMQAHGYIPKPIV